jgi:DNA polymerase III subunit epsilon
MRRWQPPIERRTAHGRPAALPATFSHGVPKTEDGDLDACGYHRAGPHCNGTYDSVREIVIDTETTGLDPLDGHRIVEIGAVEPVNRSPTGQTFHRYVCPERSMPADAVAVHGLTAEFLADKPLFGAVADEFLAFVGDAPLVAHNAGFDIAFINAELARAAKPTIAPERVVDTLVLARRKHAGGHNTLDDLV